MANQLPSRGAEPGNQRAAKEVTRDPVIAVRVTQEEKEWAKAMAEKDGFKDVSKWVRKRMGLA